ncbi:LytR/AlgR family response regulator transcription factor [Spirosoma pomorum]
MTDKLQILIVEDEAIIAENLKITLNDLGYEVAGIAYTYRQALTAISEPDTDLVLLDINLGSKSSTENGLALAEQLTKPFIFLTAYNDRQTILEATRRHPSGYLIKPVNPALLFASIQTAIEQYAVQKEGLTTSQEPEELPAFFFVKVGNRSIKLYWRDVYCLEAGKNYVQVRVSHSPVDYTIRGTLNFVMHQLVPPAQQARLRQFNRSTYVNLDFISAFDSEAIYCGDRRIENTRIPYKELQSQLTDGKI